LLASYPIEATQENWLHESLVQIIRTVHRKLDAGESIAQTQAQWVLLLPGGLTVTQLRPLTAAHGLRDKFFQYKVEAEKLTMQQRAQLLSIFNNQNRIADLLSWKIEPEVITPEFAAIHTPIQNLFDFSYKKLGDLKVRERQYDIVFESLRDNFCPFCSIERMHHPDETAQDQDHYLAKSLYPFAAANMRNLVPMCCVCNRDYKKDTNMLVNDNGVARLAFDPYNCQPTAVSLLNSRLDNIADAVAPSWQIDFEPVCQEAETWDQVFSIRTRYRRDVLDAHFNTWLSGFKNKCATDRYRGWLGSELSEQDIREQLFYYYENKEDCPAVGPGFLEPKVFAFLLNRFDQGDERVVQLVKDVVVGVDESDLGL
jgi:hypothetical protein